jgi:hypothetical protein
MADDEIEVTVFGPNGESFVFYAERTYTHEMLLRAAIYIGSSLDERGWPPESISIKY